MQQIRRADVVAQATESQRFGILRQHRLEQTLLVGQQLLARERAFDLAERAQRGLSVQGQRGLLVGRRRLRPAPPARRR